MLLYYRVQQTEGLTNLYRNLQFFCIKDIDIHFYIIKQISVMAKCVNGPLRIPEPSAFASSTATAVSSESKFDSNCSRVRCSSSPFSLSAAVRMRFLVSIKHLSQLTSLVCSSLLQKAIQYYSPSLYLLLFQGSSGILIQMQREQELSTYKNHRELS